MPFSHYDGEPIRPIEGITTDSAEGSCHSEAEHEHTKRRDIPGNTAFVPAVA